MDGRDKERLESIGNLHSKIQDNVSKIQLNAAKLLMDQENDLIRYYNAKINELKHQFEEENVKKSKKDKDFLEKETQLISELEWIKGIAQKIDQENHSLMEKYMDLKLAYQTQENDKEILLRDIVLKKKKIAFLQSQIEQYKELFEQASKEADELDEGEQSQKGRVVTDSMVIAQSQGEESVSRPASRTKNLEKVTSTSIQQFSKITQCLTSLNKAENANESKKSGMNLPKVNKKEAGGNQKSQDSLLGKTKAMMMSTSSAADVRAVNTIEKLKKQLARVTAKSKQMQIALFNEYEGRSEIETIVRKIISDYKNELLDLRESENSLRIGVEERNEISKRILTNEKIMALIHDKIFSEKPIFK